jgi:alkanesulfonate monooxygenase SsuD/methylene tetrahydromethanopterin reductase-like flavin-dependent oxidoreductase (luciferase family)
MRPHFWEHLFPHDTDPVWLHPAPVSLGDLESFSTLAYMMALHPKLKFGHTVVCQSFRNPALVAKMGADLQLLSGGRFLLGIGAGWLEQEYKAFGYDFPSAAVRVDQLAEAIQIIKALWTQEKTTFTETRPATAHHGRCIQAEDAAHNSKIRG